MELGFKILFSLKRRVCNRYELEVDTFGETYHFSTLHKDTLFESFMERSNV